MAEFAASIIGIVSAGTKIALVLSQLAADVGSAGHEARMIGGEIRSFCSVLKTLGETIETIEKSPRYAHCSELISDMTDDSLQMFTEILNAVDKLKKMTAGREGKDGNFGLVERVQWAVFKKPKLLVLRAAIEAYKTNLTLMLSTLSTAERATRRTSTLDNADALDRDRQDRSLLESLELDREATLIELAQAERHYDRSTGPATAEPSTSILDVVLDNNPPSYDTIVSNTVLGDSGLMNLARNEIQSIRSSLSRRSEIDNEALQRRIVRHSRQISSMLEDDKRRLSQRWSQTLRDEIEIATETTSSKPLDFISLQGPPKIPDQDATSALRLIENDAPTATTMNNEIESAHAFDPRNTATYIDFLSWISRLKPPAQQQVLRALRQDIDQSTYDHQEPYHSNERPSEAKSSSVNSHSRSELSLLTSTTRSMSRHLSSSGLTVSTSTASTYCQPHVARSASPRDRKATALPALQYVQPTRAGADFLSDRSRRPPGKKSLAVKSKTRVKNEPMPVQTCHIESVPPASIKTNLSTVSTPRQEALARLIGLEQNSRPSLPPTASLPELPSIYTTSPLPRIRISKYRRSRSEQTLTVAKPDMSLEDLGASQSRSVHDLIMKNDSVETSQHREAASDTSGDESDDEGSSMWWKSIGDISPQPYRRPGHTLSRTKSKRRLSAQEVIGNTVVSPAPSSCGISRVDSSARGIAVAALAHDRGVSILSPSSNTFATAE